MIDMKAESVESISLSMAMPKETVRRAVKELTAAGWAIDGRQPGRRALVVYPAFPKRVETVIINGLKYDKDRAVNYGEWLMRAFCDVLFATDDYIDLSRPPWLRNLKTKARLEIDREYLGHHVGFEFQGPQHYKTSPDEQDDAELNEQRIRDALKYRQCSLRGVTLIEITANHLTRDEMLAKADGRLPLTVYARMPDSRLLDAIEDISADYRGLVKDKAGGKSSALSLT
ncbi:MAG: hypothetical protein NUW23_14065, partial [Firmicutes bacterium]|jgi:hypothetical protein|nr:hypothetical protein [Bacillota bacterium]